MIPMVLRKGSLAYFDSLTSGLVACKVLSIKPYAHLQGSFLATIRITSSKHAPYKQGEVITTAAHFVVPRGSVSRRNNKPYIRPYHIEAD